jgi:Xaa-Pro aminopeptidase
MTLAARTYLASRTGRLRDRLVELHVEALLVTHLPNIFYLTNFRGSSAFLVISADRTVLLTDGRYAAEVETLIAAGSACPGLEFVRVGTSRGASYEETLCDVLTTMRLACLGFESPYVSVKRWEWLTLALRETRLIPTEGLIETARSTKDGYEVATLRTAARMISDLVPRAIDLVAAGAVEREIAAEIDWLLRDGGFERPAFDTIVASGPHSALPHAKPGTRRLERGDLVVLDFGGVYDGYCVDLSRVATVSEPREDLRRLYDAVTAAHDAAIRLVRPGALPAEIDGAARRVLAEQGLSDAFVHSTGHGLGIEVHEAPRIGQPTTGGTGSDRPLEPGMVFTVEPGVYLAGRGGARLEDDVLVTDDGCEVLTTASRALAIR